MTQEIIELLTLYLKQREKMSEEEKNIILKAIQIYLLSKRKEG